jgi:hypothetical protein
MQNYAAREWTEISDKERAVIGLIDVEIEQQEAFMLRHSLLFQQLHMRKDILLRALGDTEDKVNSYFERGFAMYSNTPKPLKAHHLLRLLGTFALAFEKEKDFLLPLQKKVRRLLLQISVFKQRENALRALYILRNCLSAHPFEMDDTLPHVLRIIATARERTDITMQDNATIVQLRKLLTDSEWAA